MTLNKLVRNLAVGAVLYAGCGDGDKTTVNNNYSGRDGGAQSQGSGNLLSELCEAMCANRDCSAKLLEFSDSNDPNFPCYERCTNFFVLGCSDSLLRRATDCYKQAVCSKDSSHPCLDETDSPLARCADDSYLLSF